MRRPLDSVDTLNPGLLFGRKNRLYQPPPQGPTERSHWARDVAT